jgi:single-stranded-DNA-specific exonuclease
MATFRIAPPVPDTVATDLAHLPPLAQQLLYTRGVTAKAEADSFLAPSYDAHLFSPHLLHDMEKAVDRILLAVANREQIAIYSDYDCDGIPGGVVLHDLFAAIGHEQFLNHIPHRHYDGFGLHEAAVAQLADKGVTLIITVDCGTTDVAAVALARTRGVDVIITDHHQPSSELPDALAIVNPQLGEYPFRGLCGAAVAYKLAQAVLATGSFKVLPGQEKWWLDMVGLATIADMVPLVSENRVFAHYGLIVLRKTRRPGLQQLLRTQRVNLRTLSEDDIGFTIGPRINAASRMDTPEDAFTMLASQDEFEAGLRVAHLEKLNNERKGIVAAMTREAHNHLKALDDVPSVIVLGSPEWRPSLVGLVANKLAEEHTRPAFVWGRDGNGKLKGSCRSGGTVSVHALMEVVAEHFHEYGGHHFSGGFGVQEAAIHTLPKALCEAFETLGAQAVIPNELLVDYVCGLDALTTEVFRIQQQLAPFGAGNPKPLYLVSAVAETVEVFGKGKEHTKLTFKTRGVAREAIAFFKQPEQFSVVPVAGQRLQLLAHLESSSFMGRTQTRLRLVDIV